MTENMHAADRPTTPQWGRGDLPGGPAGPAHWRGGTTGGSSLHRFLGGSPLGVLTRLVFVSLIVGALLMWLDIRPVDLFRMLTRFIDRLWSLGFDAVREFAAYLVAGAVIVVPVWFVLRLFSFRNGR